MIKLAWGSKNTDFRGIPNHSNQLLKEKLWMQSASSMVITAKIIYESDGKKMQLNAIILFYFIKGWSSS